MHLIFPFSWSNDWGQPYTSSGLFSVASEAGDVLVLMDVLVVGIQKVTVEYHKVDDGVIVVIGGFGVSAECVIHGSAVVESGGHMAIGVVGRFTARAGQCLDLISYGALNQPKIRAGGSSGALNSSSRS